LKVISGNKRFFALLLFALLALLALLAFEKAFELFEDFPPFDFPPFDFDPFQCIEWKSRGSLVGFYMTKVSCDTGKIYSHLAEDRCDTTGKGQYDNLVNTTKAKS